MKVFYLIIRCLLGVMYVVNFFFYFYNRKLIIMVIYICVLGVCVKINEICFKKKIRFMCVCIDNVLIY